MKNSLIKKLVVTTLCCSFAVSAFAAECTFTSEQLKLQAAGDAWLQTKMNSYANKSDFYNAINDSASSLGAEYNDYLKNFAGIAPNHLPSTEAEAAQLAAVNAVVSNSRWNFVPYAAQAGSSSPKPLSAFDPCYAPAQAMYPNNPAEIPAETPIAPPAPSPTVNPGANTDDGVTNASGLVGPGGTQQTSNLDFFAFVKNILEQDIQPLLKITTTISYLIGLLLIISGMTRLYRHGSGTQSMMHRTSPTTTAMFFVTGIVLVSFMPYLQMISNSLFTPNAQSVLMQQCGTGTNVVSGQFTTSSNDFCPMLAYSKHIPAAGSGEDAIGQALKYLLFGVLFLVGVISFIRGMLQLVKIGEGGQGGGLGKAFAHIFAGIVAVNADSFYESFQNILENNTHT